MSDNAPMTSVKTLAKKKVLGVPVLYLVGAFVAVIAVYAYKTKSVSKVPSDADALASESPDTSAADAIGGDLYPGMPSGTVIVAPADTSSAGTNSSITTNDEWVKAGVAYLIKQGTGAGVAQAALQAYLNGSQLSFAQGTLRDKVIGELGLPPDLGDIGGTDPAVPAVNTPVEAPVNDTAVQLAVKNAYQMGLGRQPSPAEVAFWVDNDATTSSIYESVQGSEEASNYRTRQAVAAYYNQYLGRAASEAEITQWSNNAKRIGLPAVEAAIRDSPEAKARK